MPHSSGGGSSSGFTHSGGHGGGSSRSGVSRHYVEGATRYCYTSPRGRKKYYFVTEEKERSLPIFEFIFIPLILFVVFMLLKGMTEQLLFVPEKLNQEEYSSGVYVLDGTGIIDTAQLETAMQEFLDATGVSPAVEFVYADEVSGDLESYAYDRYVTLFGDECHWLIELALPHAFRDEARPKWRFEGMIGDDCYPAVSYKTEDMMTKTVEWQLLKANGQNIEQRLADAWSKMAKNAPRKQLNSESVAAGSFFLIFCALALRVLIGDCMEAWELRKAVAAPEPPAMAISFSRPKCIYCGAKYKPGRDERCPGCGARIN